MATKENRLTVGIDFGTTNSCIAFDDGSRVEVIKSGRDRVIPSVVLIEPGRPPLVGRRAVAEGRDKTEFCFRSVKRLFGRKYIDGQDNGFQSVKGPDGFTWLRGPDKDHHPSEIAGMIIKDMLDYAQFRLQGKRPTHAVLTHPAAFNDIQLQCLRDAAAYAGIPVANVILKEEPVAAGTAYDFKTIRDIAIFDEGGGTFDFAIMRGGRGKLDVLAKNGLAQGGDDVDAVIVDWLKDEYWAKYNVDIGVSQKAMERLREAAEKAKIDLSQDQMAPIRLPFLETLPQRSLDVDLTRGQLEKMMADHIKDMLAVCDKVLADAGLSKGNITDWILVGGMTNVPAIKAALETYAGKEPRATIDPDEVVAYGAAMHGAVADKRRKPFSMTNIVTHDFGFETTGDVFHKVIAAGERVPPEGISKTVTITNDEDNQTELSVHVLEGDGFMASNTIRLAVADLKHLPLPKGEAEIELTFAIDSNGLKTVRHPGGAIL